MTTKTQESSSGSGGAISLLEKYATLNRGIDEARQEMAAIQDQIEECQSAIETKREERQAMEKELEMNESSSSSSSITRKDKSGSTMVDDNNDDDDRSSLERMQAALRNKTRAQQRLDFRKRYQRQQLEEEFLENARSFRNRCKRLRMQANEFDETVAAHAFLEANGIHAPQQEGDNEEKEEERDVTSVTEADNSLEDEWRFEAMSEARHVDSEEDSEMSEANHSYRKAFEALQDTNKQLQSIQQRHQAAVKAQQMRLKRQKQLQVQLERIRADSKSLETELTDLQEQTKETKSMTESFRKRAMAKRKSQPSTTTTTTTPNTTRAATNNPYANRATNTRRRNQNNNNDMARACAPHFRDTPQTARERQHPHLTGRRRRDRQFDSSLGIIGGADLLDFNNDPVESPALEPMDLSMALDDDDDDDDDDDMDVLNSCPAFGS